MATVKKRGIIESYNKSSDSNIPTEDYISDSKSVVTMDGYLGKLKWMKDLNTFYVYSEKGWIDIKYIFKPETIIIDYKENTSYNLYDIVIYNKVLYVSLASSNKTSLTDSNSWLKLTTEIIEERNTFTNITTKRNSIVRYGNEFFIAKFDISATTPSNPITNPENWFKIVLSAIAPYDKTYPYKAGDIVNSSGIYYISTINRNTSTLPDSGKISTTTNWIEIVTSKSFTSFFKLLYNEISKNVIIPLYNSEKTYGVGELVIDSKFLVYISLKSDNKGNVIIDKSDYWLRLLNYSDLENLVTQVNTSINELKNSTTTSINSLTTNLENVDKESKSRDVIIQTNFESLSTSISNYITEINKSIDTYSKANEAMRIKRHEVFIPGGTKGYRIKISDINTNGGVICNYQLYDCTVIEETGETRYVPISWDNGTTNYLLNNCTELLFETVDADKHSKGIYVVLTYQPTIS